MRALGRLAPALLAAALSSPGPGDPVAARPAHGTSATASDLTAAGWTSLEPGLDLGAFPGPPGAPGDGLVWVARIDPRRFELRLVNASAWDARPRTVRAWVIAAKAAAGINAGMFQTDGLTSVGLMRTREHQNNPRRSARYKAVLAFDPLQADLAPVRILDAACGEVEPLSPRYGALLQSIRMVSCDRKNVWAPDAKRASAAAVGIDGAGRVLLVHARSAWPIHDLVDALLALPALDLRRAMYLEGGPEAQLFVRGGGRQVERLGAVEGSSGDGGFAWEIPNALVAVRRPD